MHYPCSILLAWLLLVSLPSKIEALTPDSSRREEVAGLISWLLDSDRDLARIPFADVIAATAAVEVLPFDPQDPNDSRIVHRIGEALDNLLQEINHPEHPIHEVGRINEVSGHLEDLLMDELNAIEDFVCTFPLTAGGRIQRSGYPDLRLQDLASGRVFYLDPKVYRAGSEGSTFRTFYFEPKVDTNKITENATHLIAGISHGGRIDGKWVFLRWNLVDLHAFEVRLKAEFQGSNRDLYRPESIIARGGDSDE